MDWKDRIRAHAATTGRALHESPVGLGLDFADGCDAFWILPGEVASTLPVPPDGPTSVDDLLAAYDRIDHVRDRALHVLRHYIASKRIRVTLDRSGEWGLEWEGGGGTSSISVGAHLTAVARDTGDVHEVVRAAVTHSWVGKVPSRTRIDRYLRTPAPPAAAAPSPPPSAQPPSGIRRTLALMGVCNTIDYAAGNAVAADKLATRAAPNGRIARMLLRLADRLPAAEAHVDLLKRGTVSIEFDDGYASFDLETRARPLARRIAADGPTAVADRLADEFLALNRARTRTLRAIRQAAAARGWRKDEFRPGLLFGGAKPVVHLGLTHREVSFDPEDELTAALRTTPPQDVLARIFSSAPDFARACADALSDPLPDDPIVPDATLAPRDVPAAPPLRDPDAVLAKELDAFAADTLRAYLAERRTIWDYRDPDVYDPATDTWATRADWVRVAERHLDGECPNPMAVKILLEAGDPRGDALARRYVSTAEPHHEVGDAAVEIVWRYRHAFPAVARAWFTTSEGNDVPFADVRARLGDPVALRNATVEFRPDDDGVDLHSNPAAIERVDATRRAAIHRDALAWARINHRWSPPDAGPLQVARRMAWPDVADALEQNPYLLAGLLTRDRRDDGMDEPGMLTAKPFLLAWSRLAPSPFLARLLATAYATDLVGLAEQAARQVAILKPETAASLDMVANTYRAWLKDFHVALSVAWTRCRRAEKRGGAR